MRAGRKAVINIKLVQEGERLIFSVRNPVAEKVQVTDGIVLDSSGGMHGVGLIINKMNQVKGRLKMKSYMTNVMLSDIKSHYTEEENNIIIGHA